MGLFRKTCGVCGCTIHGKYLDIANKNGQHLYNICLDCDDKFKTATSYSKSHPTDVEETKRIVGIKSTDASSPQTNQYSNFELHKGFILAHTIIALAFIIVSIVYFNLLSSFIDGIGFGIIMGLIFAGIVFGMYFLVDLGLSNRFSYESETNFGKTIANIFRWLVVIFILAYAIISNTADDDTIGYKYGDYSQYSCEDCGKPADGGRFHLLDRPDQYYCYEHYNEHKKWADEYEAQKEADKYKVACNLCGKKFDKSSLDGENIIKDKYCIDCEADLIGFDREFGD